MITIYLCNLSIGEKYVAVDCTNNKRSPAKDTPAQALASMYLSATYWTSTNEDIIQTFDINLPKNYDNDNFSQDYPELCL